MNPLNEILTWTRRLPDWQRDAVRRLFQQENGLTAADYDDLYALLKAGRGLPNPKNLSPVPLDASHLPTNIQSGQSVTLIEMRDLENVNRIALSQTLSFSKSGITVIYGGNGSGKSGYVRVMKQACRSRDSSEPVYANVNNPVCDRLTPTAKFRIDHQGVEQEIVWKYKDTPPDILSAVSIFDARCARSYLTAEQDVAYLPYGLDIVENLANSVIPELTRRLNEEIRGVDANRAAFNHLLGETAVGKQISQLGPRSKPSDITALGTLSDEELRHIDALKKALAESDPVAKANEIKRFVSRLKYLDDRIKKSSLWVNDDAISRLQAIDGDVIQAQDAEKRAALALQAGETLLPGTGEHLWKLMFESARKYSTEVAYPGKSFPHTGEAARCPLCQTPLDEAGERLARFEQYIKDDVAKTAEEKRKNIGEIRRKIEKSDLTFAIDDSLSEEISSVNPGLLLAIREFEKSLAERKQWMLGELDAHQWENPPDFADDPRQALRSMAARNLREAKTFLKAADEGRKKALSIEYDELVARQNLKGCLQAVLDLIDRMKKVALLKTCESQLNTRSISNKSRELASSAVTKELKNALDAEFINLNVGHIRTKLREKNTKGKIFHQLLLELPTTRAINEILSEGEQRAIALGAFLAELSLSNHSCGIVFDDPVSSLDHWRRRHVARRLVEEAGRRQVIVFTHDTSFLGQLRDEIDAKNLAYKIQYLEWKGDSAGHVNEGLPWGHSSYKERIDAMEKEQRRLVSKPWAAYPSDEDIGEMARAYSRLRSTIERVIQDVVFNGVVQRYRDWISVRGLEGVVGFSDNEYQEINRLYDRCSDLVEAHDPASAKNAPTPTPSELLTDIQDLKTVIETIKSRRSAQKTATP